MSQEKYYDYYKSTPEKKTELWAEFGLNVTKKRDEILEELMAETGCIAWRERGGFGKPDYICELVYPEDHKLLSEPHIKIESGLMKYEGLDVYAVRGMGNRKDGKMFNAVIADFNKRLAVFPKYTDWIIGKLDIMRTGFGGASGRGYGTAMLSTYGGNAQDVIVVAIPNDSDHAAHSPVEIPDCLERITYGEFYDLTNSKEQS